MVDRGSGATRVSVPLPTAIPMLSPEHGLGLVVARQPSSQWLRDILRYIRLDRKFTPDTMPYNNKAGRPLQRLGIGGELLDASDVQRVPWSNVGSCGRPLRIHLAHYERLHGNDPGATRSVARASPVSRPPKLLIQTPPHMSGTIQPPFDPALRLMPTVIGIRWIL